MSAEKQALLDEVKEKINLKEGFILASYDRLNANTIAGIRKSLVAVGGDMFIVKKRIFAKAASLKDVTYSLEELEGHVLLAMAKGNFPQVAKVIYDAKNETKAIKILGGYFEGGKSIVSDIEQISTLPSLDVMRAQIIGLLEAPMGQTLATLEAIVSSVMDCAENKDSKET
jgi:large subunit ribosomal protein L10